MTEESPNRALHDIGGIARFRCTPVEHDEAPPEAFGKKVDAIRQILAKKKMMAAEKALKRANSKRPIAATDASSSSKRLKRNSA